MHRRLQLAAVVGLLALFAETSAGDSTTDPEELRKLPIPELQQLASRGDMNAKLVLGYEFFLGERVTIDRQKALELYIEASDLGSDMAMGNICNMYHYGYGVAQNEAAAFRWCEKAARLGNPNAMVMIAEMLQRADGLARDKPREFRDKLAYRFYEMAAKRGHKVGQYMQGLDQEKGIGTEEDLDAALASYEASAKQGYEPAIEALRRHCQ